MNQWLRWGRRRYSMMSRNQPSSQQKDEEVAALLVEDSAVGEAIDPVLATTLIDCTVNKVWNNGRARQVLKTIMEENSRPENVDFFKVKLNKEVYSTQPKWAKEKDKKLGAIQSGLATASSPLVQLINSVKQEQPVDKTAVKKACFPSKN